MTDWTKTAHSYKVLGMSGGLFAFIFLAFFAAIFTSSITLFVIAVLVFILNIIAEKFLNLPFKYLGYWILSWFSGAIKRPRRVKRTYYSDDR